MQVRKIKAFSMMELIVVMIITGILMAIAYLSYSIIAKQFRYFSTSSSSLIEISNLNFSLSRDFDDSENLVVKGEELLVNKDSIQIIYSFQDDYITRTQNEVTDTFKTPVKDKKFYFQYQENFLNPGYIDELEFNYDYNEQQFNYHFYKRYSNEQLYRMNEGGGGR